MGSEVMGFFWFLFDVLYGVMDLGLLWFKDWKGGKEVLRKVFLDMFVLVGYEEILDFDMEEKFSFFLRKEFIIKLEGELLEWEWQRIEQFWGFVFKFFGMSLFMILVKYIFLVWDGRRLEFKFDKSKLFQLKNDMGLECGYKVLVKEVKKFNFWFIFKFKIDLLEEKLDVIFQNFFLKFRFQVRLKLIFFFKIELFQGED